MGEVSTLADDGHPRLLDAGGATGPRYARRLCDKVLVAFHHACDQGDQEVAAQLLTVVESMLRKDSRTPDGAGRRRNIESLVAGYERLWQLRHVGDDLG